MDYPVDSNGDKMLMLMQINCEEACLKAAKDDKDIYVGVRSAKYTKVDTDEGTGDLKVVFFVCNGTKNPIKEIFGLSEAGVTVKKYETAKDKKLEDVSFDMSEEAKRRAINENKRFFGKIYRRYRKR